MKLTTEQAANTLHTVIRVVAEEIDSEMPWHQGLVFLMVCKADPERGMTMKEVAAALGLSTSAASRNLAALGNWHRQRHPGLGLIEVREDLMDRRRRPNFLSPKGEEALARITASLNKAIARNID